MPLFVCDQCDCVDNTAFGGNYWFRHVKREGRGTGAVLCTECVSGTWHNQFPKVKFEPQSQTVESIIHLRRHGYVPARHHAACDVRLAASKT